MVRKTSNQWIAHYIAKLTTLEGRRHSEADQKLVQDLHNKASQLGAECIPFDGKRKDPVQFLHDKAVALGADCPVAEAHLEDMASGSHLRFAAAGAEAAFQERHQMLRAGSLRSAQLRFLQRMEAATATATPPDGYALAIKAAASAKPEPFGSLDLETAEGYSPKGQPADGYTMRLLADADSIEVPIEPSDTPGYDPFGTPPDPYALGLKTLELRRNDEMAMAHSEKTCGCKK
jgi:hypothetical protein